MIAIGVTGSTGFIGLALVAMLSARDLQHIEIGRHSLPAPVLLGIDVVLHVAGMVHRKGTAEEFDNANHQTTRRVVEAAIRDGVRRFILVSSASAVTAESPYGISKRNAEEALMARSQDIEAVIVRPPLVYGRGAKGYFRKLLRLCDSGLPLPFASVQNQRSYVGVTNLCDALVLLATHPDAAGVYAVTDDESISLPEAVSRIRRAAHIPPRLLPFPPSILKAGLRAAGMGSLSRQLMDDLVIDGSALRAKGWTPPLPTMAADDLRRLAADRSPTTNERAG